MIDVRQKMLDRADRVEAAGKEFTAGLTELRTLAGLLPEIGDPEKRKQWESALELLEKTSLSVVLAGLIPVLVRAVLDPKPKAEVQP